jgi:hypothetical protein
MAVGEEAFGDGWVATTRIRCVDYRRRKSIT